MIDINKIVKSVLNKKYVKTTKDFPICCGVKTLDLFNGKTFRVYLCAKCNKEYKYTIRSK